LLVFAVTLFVSAALMFLVELMFAKMVLPLLGGMPAVWNACVLFFQATLLAGYAYAHWATSLLRPRTQALLHLALILPAVLLLPIGISRGWTPPEQGNPIPWLLALMIVSVGLPFFVISTTSPLLQRWFAYTGHHGADDPYFLYAASNAGSLAGLIGYLVVIEPNLTLGEQSSIIKWGCILLVLFTYACAFMVFRAMNGRERVEENPVERPRIPARRTLRWLGLAFVPSSLMLGVTTYLTTDIAAVPLLWAIPLTLYLITFMLAFARRSFVPYGILIRALPMLVLVQTVVIAKATLPMPWQPILHLVTFFTVAMVCHYQLARDRPPVENLTEFYLVIATGGALGSVFNGLIAPIAFRSVAEYPLVMILACMLCLPNRQRASARRPAAAPRPAFAYHDVVLPIGLGALTAAALVTARSVSPDLPVRGVAIILGVMAVLCFALSDRPIRFALGLGALLFVIAVNPRAPTHTIYQERDFFGVLRVVNDPKGHFHQLYHGSTIHGVQSTSPELRSEPLAYYSRTGPAGDIFGDFAQRTRNGRVGLVGLGAGALTAYGRKGDDFTYYEINPEVERIARDPRFFTFIEDARKRGVAVRTVFGDGRLALAKAPDRSYDLIVLDAFSGDSIPVHLLTREAIRLYLSKLREHGMIAFHISNHYLDIEPVLAELAADAGAQALIRDYSLISGSDRRLADVGSQWVIFAQDERGLGSLFTDSSWLDMIEKPGMRVWTDDYSNILQVMLWKG